LAATTNKAPMMEITDAASRASLGVASAMAPDVAPSFGAVSSVGVAPGLGAVGSVGFGARPGA